MPSSPTPSSSLLNPLNEGGPQQGRKSETFREMSIHPSKRNRIEELLGKVRDKESCKLSVCKALSALLTSVSLDLPTADSGTVLIFASNYSQELGNLVVRPDLLAFLGDRDTAVSVASGATTSLDDMPPRQSIICPVEVSSDGTGTAQIENYMSDVARYDPNSTIQYGIYANREGFVLFAIGLADFTHWENVEWDHPNCVNKIYSCVEIIRESRTSSKQIPPTIPRLISNFSLEFEHWRLFLYKAMARHTSFTLLPLSFGRLSRKPFVAIAVASDGERDKPDMVRIFKYSWYQEKHRGRERNLLLKLRGVPGVVQIDESMCSDLIDVDEWSGAVRTRLALKTIGYPLCSCESALEFLEAMYDLLEVLRYIVQEKGVIHRDISWRNVLIRPEHSPDVTIDIREQPTNEPISHTYRFISDIFGEERRVRVALTDFDLASDLENASDEELREPRGTQMFMAYDVLRPRQHAIHMDAGTANDLQTGAMDSSMEDSGRSKYSDKSERDAWDAFCSCLSGIEYRQRDRFKKPFQHGAVHDAESVFYLCYFFFNRMQRLGGGDPANIAEEREWGSAFETLASRSFELRASTEDFEEAIAIGIDREFQELLQTINEYLGFPWYKVKSTGRGEKYEFHLHDFMQRLFLKEIWRLRRPGADPIAISDKPRRVRTRGARYKGVASDPRDLLSFLDRRQMELGIPKLLPGLMEGSEEKHTVSEALGQSEHASVFKLSHFILLKCKEREKLWTNSDPLIDYE